MDITKAQQRSTAARSAVTFSAASPRKPPVSIPVERERLLPRLHRRAVVQYDILRRVSDPMLAANLRDRPPPSPSFKIATACVSLNLDLFIRLLLRPYCQKTPALNLCTYKGSSQADMEKVANQLNFAGCGAAASINQTVAIEAPCPRMVSTVVKGFFRDMDRRR
jgi:hypothetical protein